MGTLSKKKLLVVFGFIYLLICNFSYAQPANDDFANAQALTLNTCSGDAAYTTIAATPDLNAGSCWNNGGPLFNVWFSFVASSTGQVNVTIDRGGAQGSMDRTQVAIWDNTGTGEVACKYYSFTGEDVKVGALGLTDGATYYISVDAFSNSYDGTFTICIDDAVDYDFYEGAEDVTGLIGTCSADAAYTTDGGSGDLNAGACWYNGPSYNRWFKFTAPVSGQIKATVDIGGAQGNQGRTMLSIWEADGTTELACNVWTVSTQDLSAQTQALTAGLTYYISVDVSNPAYTGTFTLCLEDAVDYDFYEGAEDITALFGTGCSADEAYTTMGGTSDKNVGSCWYSGPNYNRWFKFTAPASGNVNVKVDVGSGKGTQTKTQLALWENDGTTEITCSVYTSTGDDVSLNALGLTPGIVYFVSVDAFDSNSDGTFTMCLQDSPDYDYYEGAEDITGLIGTCSADAAYTTSGATPDKNAGSCWTNGGPLYNRWFQFTSPADGILSITIDINSTQGNQERTMAAIWESDGTTEVKCQVYGGTYEDVKISSVDLTPSTTYYLSVDVFNAASRGTFTLCLENSVDYDFYEGATDVTSLIGSCSADAAYTTAGASPDKNAGSCWSSGPNKNRWFYFTAPASGQINATINIGGTSGNMSRSMAALWESDGTTEINCSNYLSSSDDIVVAAQNLTPGNTYYLSVDVNGTAYANTFTLCLDDAVDYDYYEGAKDVTYLINSCSNDAEYTTVAAHGDKNAGSCWYNGPNLNRWFKLEAPASGILSITVDVGSSKGTQLRSYIGLWESDGTTEVGCAAYSNANDDVTLNASGLTPGATYYISVDTFNGSNDGTFTLCISDNFDYDFYEGAYEITDLNGWCSADEEFTTKGATPDLNPGSCWNNGGPVQNRWFKFKAIHTDVSITVDIDGTKGDQRFTQLALWESDGTTEVDCNLYAVSNDDVTITNTGLTAGNWYYISVDTFNDSNDGTFTLCVDNVQNTYYSIADGNYNLGTTWSLISHVGAAAGSVPGDGDFVNIEGHTITVTDAQSSGGMNINVATANTGLTIDAATLTINGNLQMINSGSNFDGNIALVNAGNLTITGDFNLDRSGGANTFDVSIGTGSTLSVGNDMAWNSSAGSAVNSTLTTSGNGQLNIGNDLNLTYTGGNKIYMQMDGSSSLSLTNDLNFDCSTNNTCEIVFNSTASFDIMSDIKRTGGFGILTFNGTTELSMMGAFTQTLPENSGSGGDAITFSNVTINNTGTTIPQVITEGPISIAGSFTLTDGVVQTASDKLLSFDAGATLLGGNANSYFDGPVAKTGNTDFTFQLGSGSTWAPLLIAGLTGDAATVFTAEYSSGAYADMTLKTSDPNGDLNNVSSLEYWNLSNSGTISSADLTLYWKDNTASYIDDPSELVIAHFTGTEWENLDVDSFTDGGTTGDITVLGVSSFSPFTFGSKSAVANPLPVEFASFEAIQEKGSVLLQWSTTTEVDNDYFELQRSGDGISFYGIREIKGRGTSNELSFYSTIDRNPIAGTSYYRLKQVDWDGTASFSDILSVTNNLEASFDFNFYPNPVSNGAEVKWSIKGLNRSEKFQIVINDLAGKLIFKKELTIVEQSLIESKINGLQKGVYTISCVSAAGKVTKTIVRQ